MPSQLRAGLYACDPSALTEIVDKSLARLVSALADPTFIVDRDRMSAYMQMIGIEVGELRHMLAKEREAHQQTAKIAHERFEEVRLLKAKLAWMEGRAA